MKNLNRINFCIALFALCLSVFNIALKVSQFRAGYRAGYIKAYKDATDLIQDMNNAYQVESFPDHSRIPNDNLKTK